MSQNDEVFNPFDPAGLFKDLRGAGMDAWSKMMVQFVNSEAYARATGAMLDAWLAGSAPFRKATESAMARVLAGLSMPSRAELASLAERLTHIELRLDDLEAKLEEAPRAARKAGAGRARPYPAEEPS